MKILKKAAVVAAVAIAGAAAAQDRGGAPPVAVYWMSAQTSSGLLAGMGMGGPGQRPGMGAVFGMMARGGPDPNAVSRTLHLQLGSIRRAPGDPQAEHDPTQALGVGPSLPLVSPPPPSPSAAPPPEEERPQPPQQYQRPRGRMLIFWGCGEHAGPHQPLVIDYATAGDNPAAMMELMRSVTVQGMRPPSPGRYATYGEWPNRLSNTQIPPNGSLVGDHVVRGDYTPDMHFSLGPDRDFLAPVRMISNAPTPTGSINLAWQPIPGMLGSFIAVMGGGGQDTAVMWTSSAQRMFGFGLPDYLAPSETRRLVGSGVLMPPQQTSCLVPQEAAQALGGHGFFNFSGFGDEANFGGPLPHRPPEWVVKVRYRTTTSGMLGQSGFGGDRGDQQQHHGGFGLGVGIGGFFGH